MNILIEGFDPIASFGAAWDDMLHGTSTGSAIGLDRLTTRRWLNLSYTYWTKPIDTWRFYGIVSFKKSPSTISSLQPFSE